MRSLYLGTSDFAAVVLRRLASGPHRPDLVVTPPDRPRGRGRRLAAPPVAEAATELGIDLFQAADVNEAASRERLLEGGPEVAIVCAFGQLVGDELLGSVEMLNVHPSLLPRWRGAAPIERSIMAGDEVTGVCVMKLTAGLDSGPVALSAEERIGSADDYGSLSARLAEAGGRLLGEALDRLVAGRLGFEEQAAEGITYADKIASAERQVDPRNDARSESLRIRALTPHVGAFAMLGDGSRLGLRQPSLLAAGPEPGRFAATATGLALGFAGGGLEIGAVQPPGKRWMGAADYVRGYGAPEAAVVAPT
ncbi:MAG: methionyl-tRNA formyltransferase [Solirubrobacterales bacterium]|nr:methionyl-tRNA formyltransferase [Solirubrobacterales bacterium]